MELLLVLALKLAGALIFKTISYPLLAIAATSILFKLWGTGLCT